MEMAECTICADGKVITKHGLKIHMGKIHGVHSFERMGDYAGSRLPNPVPSIEPEMESSLESLDVPQQGGDLVPCGHPFCKVSLPSGELRAHWGSDHPTWLMSNGKYVFEV
jgi:hypothetical protein